MKKLIRMKIMLMSLILMTAVVGLAQEKKAETKPAAKSAEALPAVDDILDKYVKALGGKEAIEKVTSRSEKGTFELPSFGASGTLESYSKAPNKTSMVIEIGGFGKVESVFDGTKGWSADPQGGLREQTGGELAAVKRQAEFHRELKLKSQYSKMEVKGKEKVGDADTYVIEATPADGKPEKLYFDAANGLLVRMDVETDTPQGSMAFQVFMEDYKAVDGIKIPHTMRRNSEAFNMTIKLTEVKHNVTVEDSKFNKPSGN